MYVAVLHTLCVPIWCIVYFIYESFFTSYKKDKIVNISTVIQGRTSLCVLACE